MPLYYFCIYCFSRIKQCGGLKILMAKHLDTHESHRFLSSENLMRSICNPILEPMGISFFYFLRLFSDNSYSILTNNNKIIEYMFSEFITHNIPLIAPADFKIVSNNFCYLILPMGPYVKVVHDMKNHLNIAYCLNILEKRENYINAYCFGSTADNEGVINYYLNNYDVLSKFILSLQEKLPNLIKICNKNPFMVPDMFSNLFNYQNNSDINIHDENIFSGQILTNQFKISQREYDCLYHLAYGKTAKQIAIKLNISYRTVEEYLTNARRKLSCSNRSQLIEKIINSGIL